MCSAFKTELLAKGQVSLFNFDLAEPLRNFVDYELEGHLQYIFRYIFQYMYPLKGTEVND